jgi:PAS domain S-box-containing protein
MSGSAGSALLEASREFLLLVALDTLAIRDINDYACEALGRSRADLVGRPITELECALEDVFYWEEVRSGHFRPLSRAQGLYACANGELLPVTKSVFLLAERTPAVIAICARDARETAKAEAQLARLTSMLQATFESTAEGILVVDRDGLVLNYNVRFLRLLGVTPEGADAAGQRRMLRQAARQSRQPARTIRLWARLVRLHAEEDAFRIEMRDGRTLRCRSRPLMLGEQVEGRVVSFEDISERIARERELAAARDEAAASAKAKADFLAMMSHEIRTPLTGILGMTELILDTTLDREQREHLEMAHQSAAGLLTIINDILDFSRLEAGKLHVETIPFELAGSLAATARPLGWQARKQGIGFALEIPAGQPLWVLGDPARIQQIVINLVGNAIKFTEAGTVTVSLASAPGVPGRRRIRIAVRDTGIGIPPDKLGLIFQAFAQSDTSISRRFGGTGLGLSISSRLARLMGGEILVESEAGRGSCFTLCLDLAEAAPPADAPAADAVEAPGRRLDILLAEDTPVNQIFLSTVLGKAGHAVTIAGDGEAAVRAATAGHTFDVILMDIQMPLLDGFAATRRLRDAGVATPVIALTAHVAEGFRDTCLASGMDDYLAKPVDTRELLRTIGRLAGRPQEGPAGAAAPAAAESAVAVLDVATALDRLDCGPEVFLTLLAATETQIADDRRHIVDSQADGDGEALARHAHRLKGSLGTIGATRAFQACLAVELAARRGEGESLPGLVEALQREIAVLGEAVAAYRRNPETG